MVSLQAESTPWFHFYHPPPEENLYISTYATTLCPSYECDIELIPPTSGDPEVEQSILKYLQNSFVAAYLSSPLRFSSHEHYTLFLPIQCDDMEASLVKLFTEGHSFEQRQVRVEGQAWQESILLHHMCPYRILPEELQKQQVNVTTKRGQFNLNEYGWITPENQILHYLEFPHATLFFITSEIKNSVL